MNSFTKSVKVKDRNLTVFTASDPALQAQLNTLLCCNAISQTWEAGSKIAVPTFKAQKVADYLVSRGWIAA